MYITLRSNRWYQIDSNLVRVHLKSNFFERIHSYVRIISETFIGIYNDAHTENVSDCSK